MGYPGAYPKVISVAAAGWVGEWNDPAANCPAVSAPDALTASRFWRQCDVPEGFDPNNYYITDFSAEPKADAAAGPQDLDVAAPGSWVVGPWQEQQGKISYFFIGGTSQAAPHVTGMVALLLDQDPALATSSIEGKLEAAAQALHYRNQMVRPRIRRRSFSSLRRYRTGVSKASREDQGRPWFHHCRRCIGKLI